MCTTCKKYNSVFNYSQSYPQYPQLSTVDKYCKNMVYQINIMSRKSYNCNKKEKKL